MAENSVFRFCGIDFIQSEAIHKIGTDALVLATVAQMPDAQRILDIGTGSGILALVMAHKHPHAHVDAVEIDAIAADLATKNAQNSIHAERCTVINSDLTDFCKPENRAAYDLIVSNPPYFSGKSTPSPARSLARQDATLSPAQLFQAARYLLQENGQFWIILPTERLQVYHQTACLHGLFFNLEMEIIMKKPEVTEAQPIGRTVVVYGRNAVLYAKNKKIVSYEWAI
jgi:tRNA1Val (adenine37-N6)-methyltransferase